VGFFSQVGDMISWPVTKLVTVKPGAARAVLSSVRL
jgi:hypothetical protein